MAYQLFIHADAKKDLAELQLKDRRAAALIVAMLEEIEGDQRLLDALTVHDFGDDGNEKFHVSKWLEMWNKGLDLWRIRIWALDRIAPYRVVYAYERGKQRYHVLGVFHRDFNYDPADARVKRVKDAYEQL